MKSGIPTGTFGTYRHSHSSINGWFSNVFDPLRIEPLMGLQYSSMLNAMSGRNRHVSSTRSEESGSLLDAE